MPTWNFMNGTFSCARGGHRRAPPAAFPFDGHSAPLLATGDACACVRMMDPADGSRTWVPRDWVYLTGQQTGTREPSSVGTAAGEFAK